MQQAKKNRDKCLYATPTVICIKLDNEISLALASSPPIGPEVDATPMHLSNDPFKADKA